MKKWKFSICILIFFILVSLVWTVQAMSGGPDNFGYKFIDSNSANGPAYNWIEISGTGTQILPDSDDEWISNIPLGVASQNTPQFFFNYYGTDYSQIAIANNGLLFSAVPTDEYTNQPIKNSPSVDGFIAPYWDDIVTWDTADAIYYQTLGNAPNRIFIVEWNETQHYESSTSGITFEVILSEGTNNILMQYKDVNFGTVSGAVGGDDPPYNNGGSATVGIESPSGSDGLQYSFNEQLISPESAILFKFPQFAGTNLYLSKNAPLSMNRGNSFDYTLYFNNFGSAAASNVILTDNLPSDVEFVSASDDGNYNSVTRNVIWNIDTVAAYPSGKGYRTITVRIPNIVSIGSVIQNTASIGTSTLETRYDDNGVSTLTSITASTLPLEANIEPILGNQGGTISISWNELTWFFYDDPTATGVDIKIHLDDGGPDISGSMGNTPHGWSYATTFYPRSGSATVTYSVQGCPKTAHTPPENIRVLRTATGQIETVNFKEYVKNVLPNEWNPSWGMDALKAGAIAVKTYGWYWTIHERYPGKGYDVKDTISDQVYNPNSATGSTNQAVDETWDSVITKDDSIFESQYDSGTPGSPDPLNLGRMSQWGTKYWADQGYDWKWISHNYYDPIEGPCKPDISFDLYIDPAGYIYDIDTLGRISGASVSLQRPDGEGDWENVPAGVVPPIMQPDVNPLNTGVNGQYQWDVLEGSYRVHAEAPNYFPADSIVVNIPPPVFNLNIGLNRVPGTNIPVAVASITPNPGIVGQTIQLDGSSSYHQDPTKSIDSWSWDLNNDRTYEIEGKQVIHTFSTAGSYPIKLRVSDNGYPEHFAETTLMLVINEQKPIPEFPSIFLPATFIIGLLGAVLFIQRTREH